jgi:hypothetical protein
LFLATNTRSRMTGCARSNLFAKEKDSRFDSAVKLKNFDDRQVAYFCLIGEHQECQFCELRESRK